VGETKADRHFNGGRFWQILSGFFQNGESVAAAVDRELAPYGLTARAVWAFNAWVPLGSFLETW
jgi:hypothetical protein